MRLFVTGAGGFLGRRVVDAAISRGHEVTALVRSAAATLWTDAPEVTLVVGDLRERGEWDRSLAGSDAVIHLAASMHGDERAQYDSTVRGTEELLAAMVAAGVSRLVHLSTFSVYDFRALPVGGRLDESCALEPRPDDRDAYARTKLRQEQLVRDFASVDGGRITVLRPGLVYGPGRLWNAGRVVQLGPLAMVIAPGRDMPLTYVDNCADAVVLAAETETAIGETLDIVDDNPPTQRSFEAVLRRAGAVSGRTIAIPYGVAAGAARLAHGLVRRRPALAGRLPSFLAPARLDALYRPVHAPNSRARSVLGWTPRIGLAEGIAASTMPVERSEGSTS